MQRTLHGTVVWLPAIPGNKNGELGGTYIFL